ncbi:MAG: FKBP-type peptidyl-prolyl cis-trans isomerase [bacterium]
MDEIEGDGDPFEKGQTVSVNYTGWTLAGETFDSNVDPAFHHVEPFETEIPGGVIAGWNEGVLGMKAGGKRRLFIPSDLAYGDRGVPPSIPGGATLIFEIELLEIN